MNHCLTIQLNAEAFARLQQQAAAAGVSPEALAAAALERQRQSTDGPASAVRTPPARERFTRHFGAVDLGRPSGARNEDIDADLQLE